MREFDDSLLDSEPSHQAPPADKLNSITSQMGGIRSDVSDTNSRILLLEKSKSSGRKKTVSTVSKETVMAKFVESDPGLSTSRREIPATITSPSQMEELFTDPYDDSLDEFPHGSVKRKRTLSLSSADSETDTRQREQNQPIKTTLSP